MSRPKTSTERNQKWRAKLASPEQWAANLKRLANQNAASCRRRSQNVQCTITVAEIKELGRRQGLRCYFSGLPFRLIGHESHPAYPSLDRQNPGGHYTFENCRLVSWALNRYRGDMQTTDFIKHLHDTIYTFGTAPWTQEYCTLFQVGPLDNPPTNT